MALIELTPDDLCAAVSFPMPCEEGTIIDPVAVAHFLGLVETVSVSEPSDDAADGRSFPRRPTSADPRLVLVSLACSMEVDRIVTRAGGSGTAPTEEEGPDPDGGTAALDAFVDGVLASPPVVSTALPAAGSVVAIGTTTFTMPAGPPATAAWGEGERLHRGQLLALAARLQSASKLPGLGAAADALTRGAARLLDAAVAR